MSDRLRRSHTLRASVAILSLTGIVIAASPPSDLPPEAPAARKLATDFTVPDATGTAVRLSGYKGQVVLLDFWATWCAGCKVEIPWYIEFQKKYAKQGLRSIGVAMDDEGWQNVKPYLAAHPINYPIVLGSPDLATRYQLTSLPVTLLIDRQGRIAAAHAGLVDKDDWERRILMLLKERAG